MVDLDHVYSTELHNTCFLQLTMNPSSQVPQDSDCHWEYEMQIHSEMLTEGKRYELLCSRIPLPP